MPDEKRPTTQGEQHDEMIRYLPAIYQTAGDHSLLKHLLAAFDSILLRSKSKSGKRQALEESIANLSRYFDPRRTDPHFLPWLAGWTALSLRTDLSESKQREIIGRIVPLYGKRGTRRGIIELVELFTDGKVEIEEPADLEFQIEDHSTVAKDTYLGGPPPHVFRVLFSMPEELAHETGTERKEDHRRKIQRMLEIVRMAIEMAKPAHTWYTLEHRHEGNTEKAEQ